MEVGEVTALMLVRIC